MKGFQTLKSVCLVAALAALCVFAVGAKSAHAATTQSDYPVSFVVYSACSGELIAFSGNEHDHFNITYDNAGGAHLVYNANLQGVSGVGLTSGLTYQFPGAEHYTENFTAGTAYNATETLNEDLVSQGSAPNQRIHALYHITVDANGNVTSYMDTFTVTCNG